MTKPFLKWVGGKTQLLDTILPLLPRTLENYHEPFVGGGSVLLAILSEIQSGSRNLLGTVYASDSNPKLIALYKDIQQNPTGLLQELNLLINEFQGLQGIIVNREPQTLEEAKTSQESYYYWIRKQFNTYQGVTVKASAMFLFLNKTCFRGVYREGPHGFNVPFGHYKKPTIVEEAHLHEVSRLFQDVVFTCQGFEASFTKLQRGDTIYLDPPYAPETTTSFVGYTASGFRLEDHTKLFQLSKDLKSNHVHMVFSNANVPLVKEAFPSPAFTTRIVEARRAIHSKDPSQTTNEVLITNE